MENENNNNQNNETTTQQIEENKTVNNNESLNNPTNNTPNNDDKEATKLGTLSLVLYFGSSAIYGLLSNITPAGMSKYLSSISGMLPLAGIVLMIIGRTRYPKNTFLKTVMWIIIASTILSVIAGIIILIWCTVACTSVDWSWLKDCE